MLDWLGQEVRRILELHNWSPEYKQKKILDALKAKCQPQENAYLYKHQFFLIRQGFQETFSDLCQEVCHIYDLCRFEEEDINSDHKYCAAFKKSARDIRVNNILTLTVRDNILRTEFRKLKGKDSTETRFHQKGANWDINNATKDKYNATETVTKESIHAVSLHKKSNSSNKEDSKQ